MGKSLIMVRLDDTANGRFGGAAQRARITLCTQNLEPVLVTFNVLIHNCASLLCVRRHRWSPICGDAHCESCRLDFIDAPGLNKAGFQNDYDFLKSVFLKINRFRKC